MKKYDLHKIMKAESEEVSLRYEDCLSSTTADFYTKHTKE